MVPMDPMSIAASNERTIMRLAPPIDSSFGGYRCSYIVPASTNEAFYSRDRDCGINHDLTALCQTVSLVSRADRQTQHDKMNEENCFFTELVLTLCCSTGISFANTLNLT